MVRPRKNYEELRLFQNNIRLTDSEHQLAKELAGLAGLSVADWFRACAFSKKRPAPKAKLINKDLFIELSRIGNNINQLAHRANSGKTVLSAELSSLNELRKAITEIQKILLEI